MAYGRKEESKTGTKDRMLEPTAAALNEIIDSIAEAGMAIDRCLIMLTDLTQDYSFSVYPSTSDYGSLNDSGMTWMRGYRRAFVLADIAGDYAFKAEAAIKSAMDLANTVQRNCRKLPEGGAFE